jgi:hypothetical protein
MNESQAKVFCCTSHSRCVFLRSVIGISVEVMIRTGGCSAQVYSVSAAALTPRSWRIRHRRLLLSERRVFVLILSLHRLNSTHVFQMSSHHLDIFVSKIWLRTLLDNLNPEHMIYQTEPLLVQYLLYMTPSNPLFNSKIYTSTLLAGLTPTAASFSAISLTTLSPLSLSISALPSTPLSSGRT